MHRIIIDTDPGIDDAMAIFYALAATEIEVLGLTTVFGNVDTGLATTNALRLLDIAGRAELPVARGAARPLTGSYRGAADFVHGSNGQGNAELADPTGREDTRRATQFMAEMIDAHPGEITLVTLGPLTNLALLVLERPELAAQVRQVVAMGGNLTVPGNASPAGEANIVNDPEAADAVLSAPWPVVMCGLDVTHRITMTPQDLERIYRIPSPQGRHLAAIVPFYHAFYRSQVGSEGIYVHDSTTISYLRHADHFKTRKVPVAVDTGASVGRGKTWPCHDAQRPAATVCTGVDARFLVEQEISTLAEAL